MKERVASLLKKDIKADVLSQSSSKRNKDENVAGLFCGEKKLKIFFSGVTKKSVILTKAVVPARKPSTSSYKEHCTAPTVVPTPTRDHNLQTRTEIPDLIALSFFRKKKSVNGSRTSKGSHDPKSKKQKSGSSKN